MAEGPLHRREDIERVARQVLQDLDGLIAQYEICGSFRRNFPMSHDVDLVIQPTPQALEIPNEFGVPPRSAWDCRLDSILAKAEKAMKAQGLIPEFSRGDRIVNFTYDKISVDLYVATPDIYDCLVLIRTGSKEHNKKLTIEAMRRNMKLHADGTGLEDFNTCKNCGHHKGYCNSFTGKCEYQDPEGTCDCITFVPGRIIAKNEHDILRILLGKYVEPEQRN